MNYFYFIFFISLAFFQSSTCVAQRLPGAKQISLSHSDVALCNDVFALFNNPAGLSQINSREIGIYYSPSPFGIKQLANGFVAIHEKVEFGSLAGGFSTYGFELYRETKLALSFAKEIDKNFFIGITTLYQSISIQNYGNDDAINFIIGGIAYLQNNLRVGFAIENPTRSTYGDQENQIPVIYRSGISYDITGEITVNLAFEKEIELPGSVRFGIDYLPIEYINVRFGVMDEPSSFSAGVGINYLPIILDYALFTHQDLGLTHQAGIIVRFGDGSSENNSDKN